MFLSSLTRLQRGAILATAASAALAVLIDCGDTNTPPQKSNGITKITVTPAATGLSAPLDATPDPMGTEIYFLATGADGIGVYHVSAAGGAVAQLYAGAPLVDPHGISISSNGKTLFIADRAAGTSGGGAILTMPVAGDTPVILAGSEGTHPSALDLIDLGTADDIYFTGDASGSPAVYKLPAEGGTAQVLTKGAPLARPDGVASPSTAPCSSRISQAGMKQPGQVFKLSGDKAIAFGPELDPANPSGIAVTLDDAKAPWSRRSTRRPRPPGHHPPDQRTPPAASSTT